MVFSFCCCVQLHSRQDDSCLDEDDMLIDERNLELEMIVLVFLEDGHPSFEEDVKQVLSEQYSARFMLTLKS